MAAIMAPPAARPMAPPATFMPDGPDKEPVPGGLSRLISIGSTRIGNMNSSKATITERVSSFLISLIARNGIAYKIAAASL